MPKLTSSRLTLPARTLGRERVSVYSFSTTWTNESRSVPAPAREARRSPATTTAARQDASEAASRDQLHPRHLRRVRDDPGRVDVEPLLHERGVDASGSRTWRGGCRRGRGPCVRPGNSPTMLLAHLRRPSGRRRRRRRGRCRSSRSAAARRPNSLQTSVSTRPAMPRRSRSAGTRRAPSAICFAPSCSGPCWSAWVSYEPGPVSAAVRIGKFGVEQRREPGEPAAEVAVRVLRLRVDVHLAVLADEAAELAAEVVGLLDRAARLREDRVGIGRERAERADRVLEQLAGDVPDVVRAEAVVGRARERRDRNAGGRERREQGAVEREALHRVLVVADHVEQPAEPAGARLRIERADLPEVPRGEVRLVGMRVADRREDRQPPARVEAGERLQRRVPVEPLSRSGTPARRRASSRATFRSLR